MHLVAWQIEDAIPVGGRPRQIHPCSIRNWPPRGSDEERGISEYALNCCFPGAELGLKLVVLNGRERITGAYFATAVPTKDSTGRFSLDMAVGCLHELGDAGVRALIETDQELAIRTWAKDLVAACEEGRTIVEESPVKNSEKNGRSSERRRPWTARPDQGPTPQPGGAFGQEGQLLARVRRLPPQPPGGG